MRVQGAQGEFGSLPGKDPVTGRKRPGGGTRPAGQAAPSFLEELQESLVVEAVPEEADLPRLIAEVDAAGRELLAHPDAARLRAYQKAVRAFLMGSVRKAYRIKVVEGRGPNPKLLVFVERVEAKLDELAKTVLSSQVNPLRLLAQLEELRGLLLDLKV